MKKIIALILAMAMALALVACGGDNSTNNDAQDGNTPAANGTTVYVLGPTPDHGWTAQAGAYAQAKCDEITAAGEYKAVYMPASSGEEQVDQVNTIIANGDAAIVVMMALDDSAQAGQEALHAENIPFISFDRIIEATEAYAVLNASGDNWQCGRGIAYWLQKNGMKPGDTIVTLYGDNGTVCSRRAEGFKEFLTGAEKYSDKALGQDFETTEVWDEAAVDAALNTYATVCDWSADKAYDYMEQKMEEIVAAAKDNGGNLYIYSMDDEMTFGVMNYIETASDALKADLKELNVYISAIGGMQELYDVMADTTEGTIANTYFDDMMSMYFSPKMMQDVIDKGLEYLSGNWTYEVGSGEYQPTWIVGRDNVTQYEGFKGHA